MVELRIERAEALRLALPMITPFRTSFGLVATKQTVVVRLYAAGLVGYGEAPCFHLPIYNAESIDTCLHILRDAILPSIVGRTHSGPESFVAQYASLIGQNMAKFAVEAAFWHLQSLAQNVPLKKLVGGVKDRIEVGHSVGIKGSIEETLEEIEGSLSRGYKRIKIKIKPGWDLEVLSAIRCAWPHITLTADANSAYRLKDHLFTLLELDKFNLSMIEQPLSHDDLVDHSTLQRLLRTSLCLDESIASREDTRRAAALDACRIVNLKPPRVGGVLESLKIHDMAQRLGLKLWCGGLLETGIGRAFNIALASKSHFSLPNDMSRYDEFYEEDLVEDSFTINADGTVDVPNLPGIGFTVNEDALRRFTIDAIHT